MDEDTSVKQAISTTNISTADLEKEARLLQIQNEDKKEDAQRRMAWVALFGLLSYPIIILIAEYIGLKTTGSILAGMAPTYFVAIAAIIAAFFGKEAYVKGKQAAQGNLNGNNNG